MSSMEYNGPERRRPGAPGRSEKTTILLVDDHALFRVGMRNILEKEPGFEIVGEADDTRSAFDLSVQLSPDIILMDLSLPAPGGIETTQRIKRELPSRPGSSSWPSTRTRTPSSTPSRPARPPSSSRTWPRTTWWPSSAASPAAST